MDRVGIDYSDGTTLGVATSPVQQVASLVGDRPVPSRAMPAVVQRTAVGNKLLDVTDPDDALWLRACVRPGRRKEMATLNAEIALAATSPRTLIAGDTIEPVREAIESVPVDALPVVTTTWALSRSPMEQRRRFLRTIAQAGRPVALVAVEGVGVVPSFPTLEDRPASGHSIIGAALIDGSNRQVEALGRCWLRGRMLSWLSDRA